MKDCTDLTDEELETQFALINQERTRRQSLDTVSQEIGTVLLRARAQGILPTPQPGDPWKPVNSWEDVYMKDEEVTHNGKTWLSNINNNAGEPGVSGWREKVVDDPETGEKRYPVWFHNGGYEDDWAPGSIVWFPDEGDQLYINVHHSPNGWRPDEVGGQWEPYDPEEENNGDDGDGDES